LRIHEEAIWSYGYSYEENICRNIIFVQGEGAVIAFSFEQHSGMKLQ
jgi:hypothetical protein